MSRIQNGAPLEAPHDAHRAELLQLLGVYTLCLGSDLTHDTTQQDSCAQLLMGHTCLSAPSMLADNAK